MNELLYWRLTVLESDVKVCTSDTLQDDEVGDWVLLNAQYLFM